MIGKAVCGIISSTRHILHLGCVHKSLVLFCQRIGRHRAILTRLIRHIQYIFQCSRRLRHRRDLRLLAGCTHQHTLRCKNGFHKGGQLLHQLLLFLLKMLLVVRDHAIAGNARRRILAVGSRRKIRQRSRICHGMSGSAQSRLQSRLQLCQDLVDTLLVRKMRGQKNLLHQAHCIRQS